MFNFPTEKQLEEYNNEFLEFEALVLQFISDIFENKIEIGKTYSFLFFSFVFKVCKNKDNENFTLTIIDNLKNDFDFKLENVKVNQLYSVFCTYKVLIYTLVLSDRNKVFKDNRNIFQRLFNV